MPERKMSSMKTDNGYRDKGGVVCSLLELEKKVSSGAFRDPL